MVSAGGLTFQEFAMREPLPLTRLHDAILGFLKGREDAVLFGALAVNAYVAEPRMTQDVDIMSTAARQLAEELRAHLSERFHIAVRVRTVAGGRGLRVYQVQKQGSRHLAGIRPVPALPRSRQINDVPVMDAAELIASKVVSLQARKHSPKSGTDWRDIALLLLAFPDLKRDPGPVTDRLIEQGASSNVLARWRDLVAQEFRPEQDEDEFS